MPGDIKISPKIKVDGKENFGLGNVDWVLEGKNFKILKNKDEIIEQAILKAIISPLTDYGYGVWVKEFLGTKHIIPIRVSFALRLQRSVEWINQWYDEDVEIKSLTMQQGQLDTFVININLGKKEKEIFFKL